VRVSAVDDLFDSNGIPEGLRKVKELLDNAGIDPDAVGKIEKVKVSNWEGFSKDADGEVTVTPLQGTSIVLSPKWADGPQWPVVQPAKPTVIDDIHRPKHKRGAWKTAVVLPDPQFGYRLLDDGPDPFHDERAIRVAERIVDKVNPHNIVLLGDLLDLSQFSAKYVQEPAFALTTQKAIDRAHQFLAQLRALCPKAEIKILEGNHDQRLPQSIMRNAAAAFGIKQANIPESWPVMSVPHLLRLDDLDIEYVAGYPNGRVYINDNLACAHAPSKYRSGGSSVAASIVDERTSLITGHVHRIEQIYKTRNVREGYRTNSLTTLGCLCRIDGAVPSMHGALDAFGRPVTHYENWQQAVGVVSFKPGNGPFSLEIVPIFDGRSIFRGELV
jgi:predicted phosphodiesterase